MSLKLIELQIANPKTVEAGRISEHKQQQIQLNQDAANLLTEKQALKNGETVLEMEKYAEADANGKGNQNEQNKKADNQHIEEEKKTVHPYKGAFVDFTGEPK
ncbi:hypothetical protein FITA111629_02185 [Filibacter tadaridae]|uniref:Uncharacterized protein n=1 Tax=Filibacter tadaridae TaxID=2483811 RepID=A0A3P5XEF7_9BACL|nr:hypothetical protein [Filibacter tadaridae]VDC29730.1 hypothetical protein FILTAD_02283 [Filibacter tadaridae]